MHERRLRLASGLVLYVVWVHVCIGLQFRLRLQAWYPRALPGTATTRPVTARHSPVRGRDAPIAVHALDDLEALAPLLAAAPACGNAARVA